MNEQYYIGIISRCELEIANLERRLREESKRADDNRKECDRIKFTVSNCDFDKVDKLIKENDELKRLNETMKAVLRRIGSVSMFASENSKCVDYDIEEMFQ